ncbi:uncharacterized protein MELLADRAFT_70559 [Melampsora larici-populina 98AG31]|uniref:Uncharacterized protein n=1 Tax=Melampsora larici-populina (strain 98AG31 / pathotype 3-4-7) TaxID=747676 RepID=F4R4X9_MELLP|nr:uncharacterized protein MELLADRAFT_70559 [Melampsora larici-populina 98AG31]EGG12917.1 hypothetical protein MELLADRAFT_70559 [Melampsora larici-populina 98AG31]
MSLNHKFSADTLSDERFLIRLMEIWHFFFTGVLPTLEAIFLPLMTDEKLISVLESKNNKLLQERLQQIHLLQQVSSTSGLPPSSTSLLFKIQPKDPNETYVKKSNLGIDVRRIALECFRDSMISSVFNRFYKLLSYLYDDSLEGFNEPLSMDLVNEISHFKRLQMIGLLCGSVPNPEIEALGKLIRSGKADPSYLKEDEDLEPKDDRKCTSGLAGLKTSNPAGNLSLSPTIRSWNKNREFTRRSIRRQLGKSSLLHHHHHHHHQASKLSLSSLKTSLDLKFSDPSFSNPNETENETLVQSSSGTGTTGNTGNTGTSGQTLHSLESFKFSADHLKHVVQSKINKSMNYFGTQSVSLDDHGSIAEAV